MDEEAFYTINMLELKDKDIEFLYGFLKGDFSEEKIREIASDLKDRNKIKKVIEEEIEINDISEIYNLKNYLIESLEFRINEFNNQLKK